MLEQKRWISSAPAGREAGVAAAGAGAACAASSADERMKLLEAKRLEYEQWLKRRDDFLDKAEDDVVKIYAKMKPDAAAERLAEVKLELAAGILMKLNPKQASTILNEMDTKVAAIITGVMASAARKEDPS